MVCSHCGQGIHTYRRCPTITEEEKKEKIKQNKEKKEQANQRRRLRQERAQQFQDQNKKTDYEMINMTQHEMVLYWGFNNDNKLHQFAYMGNNSTKKFHCVKSRHRIVVIPLLEVCENNSPNAIKIIQLSPPTGEVPYKTLFDMEMKNMDGTSIIVDGEYNPTKTELDQWKECALKSKFLLDQIYKITGGNKRGLEQYENIEPFLDMVQDITIPNTCTEMDKEIAGVPSTLTNIT
jgi:uncharacterized Zn finger protein (UPF0148 family)